MFCGEIGTPSVGNVDPQKTTKTFFILGVSSYICGGGVSFNPFDLSLRKGFGQDTSGPFILVHHRCAIIASTSRLTIVHIVLY